MIERNTVLAARAFLGSGEVTAVEFAGALALESEQPRARYAIEEDARARFALGLLPLGRLKRLEHRRPRTTAGA